MKLSQRLMPLLNTDILQKIKNIVSATVVRNGSEIGITSNSTNAMIRFDNKAAKADFIAEFEIYLSAMGTSRNTGFVYRTTAWGAQGYAYLLGLHESMILFGVQDNQGGASSAWYDKGSYTHGLTAGQWVKFKVVALGTSHKIYINDVLKIDITDNSYTAPGQFGINVFGSEYQQKYRNITIN